MFWKKTHLFPKLRHRIDHTVILLDRAILYRSSIPTKRSDSASQRLLKKDAGNHVHSIITKMVKYDVVWYW